MMCLGHSFTVLALLSLNVLLLEAGKVDQLGKCSSEKHEDLMRAWLSLHAKRQSTVKITYHLSTIEPEPDISLRGTSRSG